MSNKRKTSREAISQIFLSSILLGSALSCISTSVAATPPQGTFTPLVNGIIPTFGPDATYPEACQPLLLTDGTVMVQNCDGDGVSVPHTGDIWKLTPDIYGNYVNGTWSKLAPLPKLPYAQYNGQQYLPLYFASQVLADGRVIYAGGEYQGPFYDFLGQGANGVAIYDPFKNQWTAIAPPPFFVDLYPPRAACPRDLSLDPGHLCAPSPIADGQQVVLEDGTFMIADKMSTQAALLDLKKMTWTETGTASKGNRWNDEESYTLLPDGRVLAVNCYTESHFLPDQFPYPTDPTSSQIYDPKTGKWSYAGSTINTLTDPITSEIGPQMLLPNGKVFVGGTDGHNSLYDTKTGTWSVTTTLPTAMAPTAKVAISAPSAVAGTYNNVYLGTGAHSVAPFSVSGPIVPAHSTGAPPSSVPADACAGPFDPIPANSIALVGISYADSNNNCDAIASNQLTSAGAAGIMFYIKEQNSLLDYIGGSLTVPTVMVDYTTGQALVSNLAGLTGTISNPPAPQQLGFGDTFAVLLPNGNIFMYAVTNNFFSAGVVSFLESDGVSFIQEPNPEPQPLFMNMVLLPTGQVFLSDIGTGYTGVYTSGDTSHNPAWEPKITAAPGVVHPGKTYPINGVLFNGMSSASHGSDDGQSATNYPLVRITMDATHHVFYARTHDHSFMGVAAVNKNVQTFFDVPKVWAGHNMETGPAKIEVIANGIPSKPRAITVKP